MTVLENNYKFSQIGKAAVKCLDKKEIQLLIAFEEERGETTKEFSVSISCEIDRKKLMEELK